MDYYEITNHRERGCFSFCGVNKLKYTLPTYKTFSCCHHRTPCKTAMKILSSFGSNFSYLSSLKYFRIKVVLLWSSKKKLLLQQQYFVFKSKTGKADFIQVNIVVAQHEPQSKEVDCKHNTEQRHGYTNSPQTTLCPQANKIPEF